MLKPSPIGPVPEGTARVAKAAFRKGNPLLSLRDELGAIFADADFADLFPKLGQPGLPPWRLALIGSVALAENATICSRCLSNMNTICCGSSKLMQQIPRSQA